MRRAAPYERAEAVGDWRLGIEEEGAPAVVSLLAPLFDLTRRRVMEFEGSRARVPWGGRESAVDALPPRGCRPLRRIAVFYLCGHAGARDEVCAPPSRLGQRCFLSNLLGFQ